MIATCDILEKVYECDRCDRFTKSTEFLEGTECPYCKNGKLRRKKHKMLINWEW